jgi:DNA-binding XRE family transcriptional regulator
MTKQSKLSLNDQIRAARVKMALTQDELGQLVGLSQARIAQLETQGANFTLETAVKVCRALGLELRIRRVKNP